MTVLLNTQANEATNDFQDRPTSQDFLDALNGRVFFWLSMKRLQTLLNARAYRDRRHTSCMLRRGHGWKPMQDRRNWLRTVLEAPTCRTCRSEVLTSSSLSMSKRSKSGGASAARRAKWLWK
jgi:hypothetical protein